MQHLLDREDSFCWAGFLSIIRPIFSVSLGENYPPIKESHQLALLCRIHVLDGIGVFILLGKEESRRVAF